VLQRVRELPPERKRVLRRLAQRAGRQVSVAGCLDRPADDPTNGLACSKRSAARAVWSRFCSSAWAPIPNESSINPTTRCGRIARVHLGRLEEPPVLWVPEADWREREAFWLDKSSAWLACRGKVVSFPRQHIFGRYPPNTELRYG
jgi:hypothetical protein